MARENWHRMTPDEVERRMKTDRNTGLEPKICHSRLNRFGKNTLFSPIKTEAKLCVRTVLTDPSLLVLVLICIIALFFRRFSTALSVLLILLLSTAVTAATLIKSNRIKEAMSSYSAPKARLLRGGQLMFADASTVVPGDILLLEKGDIIPCDARLLQSSDDFTVLTYLRDDKKRESYVLTKKDAAYVYGENEERHVLKRVNMVYVGGVVHTGCATAVVTETGKDTYLGSVAGPHCLASDVGEPWFLSSLQRHMNRYSLWMCAALLPITVIAVLVGRGRTDIFDILLLVFSLVASAMNEQLGAMGRMICACGVIRASMETTGDSAAIIKNYRSLDDLSKVQELFLMGDTAISDGVLHPYTAYVGDVLYHGKNLDDPAVHSLYELAYLYEQAIRKQPMPYFGDAQRPLTTGLNELGRLLSYDAESLAIRTAFLPSYTHRDRGVKAAIRSLGQPGEWERGGRFTIFRTTDPDEISGCQYYRRGGEDIPMGEKEHLLMIHIYRQLVDQGAYVVCYFREQEGAKIFEGFLAFREHFDQGAQEMRRRLTENGVRVSLFLSDESRHTLNHLLNSGWIESEQEVVRASEARQNGGLLRFFRGRRVFLGFSEEEIVSLIGKVRESGRVTASLGLRHGEAPLMNPADICFSCDISDYSPDAATEHRFVPLADDNVTVAQCDQSVRRNADVLIHRVDVEGGGLSGILNAIDSARSMNFRMMLAMQYLLIVQILRLTAVAVPLLFGMCIVSPAFLLLSSVVVDLGFVMVMAFYRCSSEVTREPQKEEAFFRHPIRSRPDWAVASVLCGLLLFLLAMIAHWTKMAPSGRQNCLFVFLALFLTQLTCLLCLLRTAGPINGRLQGHLVSAGLLLLTVSIVALIVIIPPFSGAFGGGRFRLPMLLLAVLPPIGLIGFFFLSCRYRASLTRKIWKRIRKFKGSREV